MSTNNHTYSPPSNVLCLPSTNQLEALLTIIRDKDTNRGDFIFYADRVIRLLVEEDNIFFWQIGLNHLPVVEKKIITPTGAEYNGVSFKGKICGVSIMRAGESMEQGLRESIKAIEVLISHGVKEDKILFLNLVAAPEGIKAVTSRFSKLKIITAHIDQGLDEKKYIIPGLGDFGKSDLK
ncbi:18059_t:CDS:2 [Racocetra fulgida]|uniref:18059_t:CDS:1 n=1 Tax=Racocetra fulgida TaxID=60492 RepID=A0A9N8W765_9GLOM|nr:18059_t:CDS:2 [Racocetra fulgida]